MLNKYCIISLVFISSLQANFFDYCTKLLECATPQTLYGGAIGLGFSYLFYHDYQKSKEIQNLKNEVISLKNKNEKNTLPKWTLFQKSKALSLAHPIFFTWCENEINSLSQMQEEVFAIKSYVLSQQYLAKHLNTKYGNDHNASIGDYVVHIFEKQNKNI